MTQSDFPLACKDVDVNGRIFKWWSISHPNDTLLYISGLDLDIVLYKLKAYSQFESDSQIVALRQLQQEAPEFIFAILCGYQSNPETIAAWMALYSNADIDALLSIMMSVENKSRLISLLENLFNYEDLHVSSKLVSKHFSHIIFTNYSGLYIWTTHLRPLKTNIIVQNMDIG